MAMGNEGFAAAPKGVAAPPGPEIHLGDYLGVLGRRWKWVVGFTVMAPVLVIAFCLVAPKKYTAKATVLMETSDVSAGTFTSELVTAGKQDLYSRAQFYTTERNLIQSRTNLKSVVDDADLWNRCKIDGPDPVEMLDKAVDVKGDATSKITEVSLTHKNAKCASDLANAVIDSYVRTNLDLVRSKFSDDVASLAPQLDKLRADFTASLQQGEDYKEENGLVNLDAPAGEDMKHIADLEAALTQAQVARIQVEKRYEQARHYAGDPARVANLPDALADPVVSKLRQAYIQAQAEEADLSQRYRDKHPKMLQVRAQLDELSKRMKEEVARVVDGLDLEHQGAVQREQALQQELEVARQGARDKSARAYQAHVFSDEAQARRTIFDEVSGRVIEARIVANIKANNVRVVDRAETPKKPSFPDTRLYTLLGAAVGLVLGLTAAFSSAALDRTVHGLRDLGRKSALPVGELVPASRVLAQPRGAASGDAPAAVSGAFARIAALVELERARRMPTFGSCQVVTVTGCAGGEGATTIAIGLARAAAAAGRRVLAVDAHPGSGALGRELGSEAKAGLAEWVGGSSTLESLRQSSPIPGVSVLSAGAVAGSSTLIRPDRIQAAFAGVGSAHDLVVLDAPPVTESAITQVLARFSDLVLVAAESDRTTQDQLDEVARELGRIEPVAARVILNRAI